MQSQLSGQPFANLLRRRIAEGGPVTVAQFMEWALYHPDFGYYMTGPNIGPRGDFTTSPEASPAFGKLIARHVVEVDGLLAHPGSFDIVECGPGRGTLARQVLDELMSSHPSVYERTTYWLLEISPALKETQSALLSPEHGAVCRWVEAASDIPRKIEGAILANEFIDAFPVHVVENHEERFMEQFVENADGAGFHLCLRDPSDSSLVEFVKRAGVVLYEGERIEVNLAMRRWLDQLSNTVSRAVALIIDYGDTAPGRYSEAHKQGTLLGYYSGSVTHEITEHPGQQDLTALVDFTALKIAAEEAGFTQVGLTRQAHFLLGLGLGTSETVETIGDGVKDIPTILEYRRGIMALISMEGLGRFHVAVLARGIDPAIVTANLSGLKYADLG